MGSKNKKQKKGETSNEAKASPEMVTKKIKKQNGGGEEKAAAKESSGGGFIADPMISDPRFSSAHTDPRFRRLPRREAKVTLDSRFRGVLTETASAPVDKRGKKRRKGSGKDMLREFYRIDEEEEEEEDKKKKKKNESESESEEEMKDLKAEMKRRKSEEEESKSEKLKTASSSSDEESESQEVSEEESEEIDTDEDDEAMYEEEEDGFEIPEEEMTIIDKETHRLAVVNMDWTHVSAKDLYMVFNSFIPKDGRILSVSVYPSEFGLERMKEEEIHGPKIEIDKKIEDNDDSDEEEEEEDEEVNNQKLRAYEITRLKYYFAVVECDSAATADFLYKQCDGIEFERSSNKLDLRFIPDTTVFKHPPRDTATEAPTNYEGLDFQTGALQMSKVNLSWDDDEPHRVKTLNQKFNDDQLAAFEMKEYIASSDDDESESDNEEDENADRKEKGNGKYRALLEPNKDDDEDDDDNEENGKNDEGMDMEVTFNTGLEDLSKQVREKKDQKESESLWDKYLRERREKKRAKKKNQKNDDSSDDDNQAVKEDGDDDFFVEEPKQKPSLKKKKKKEEVAVEEERSRAELELLLADENGEGGEGLKGYNIKKKGSKKGSSKEIASEAMTELDEPRFAMKLADPLYALDPTDPQFKRSGTYVRQLAQKQMEVVDPKATTKMEKEAKPESKKTERHETSTAVKSVKMKMKNQQKDSEKQKKTGNAESSSTTALSKKLKKKLEDMSKK